MPAKSKQEITESSEPVATSDSQLDTDSLKTISDRLSNIETVLQGLRSLNSAEEKTPAENGDKKTVEPEAPLKDVKPEAAKPCPKCPFSGFSMIGDVDGVKSTASPFVPFQIYQSDAGLSRNNFSNGSYSVWEMINTCLILFIAVVWIRQIFSKFVYA